MSTHSVTVMHFFTPHGRGMSHNGRTLSHVTERRTGVRLAAAMSPAIDTGMRLLSDHFVNRVQLDPQQSMRQNKTAGLITQGGVGASGV